MSHMKYHVLLANCKHMATWVLFIDVCVFGAGVFVTTGTVANLYSGHAPHSPSTSALTADF